MIALDSVKKLMINHFVNLKDMLYRSIAETCFFASSYSSLFSVFRLSMPSYAWSLIYDSLK